MAGSNNSPKKRHNVGEAQEESPAMAIARTERTRHWPALDGLRGFAVVAVLLYHLEIPHLMPGGFIGVDVFFVLSGFLITSLLIGEQGTYNKVDLRAFYIRRALRLLPALLAVLMVFSVAVEIVPSAQYLRYDSLTAVPFVFFYVGNWWFIQHSLGVFDHTWSLAIEEQFYLVFPALFMVATRRKLSRIGSAKALLALVAAEIILRSALLASGHSVNVVGNATVTHSDGILLGASLAFWLTSSEHRVSHRMINAMSVMGSAFLVVLIIALPNSSRYGPSPVWYDVGVTGATIATALLLLDQVVAPQRLIAFVLGSRAAVWVGRRSYGLYLWHYPIYRLVILAPGPIGHRYLLDALVFFGSFVVAGVSYEVIEKPALRLKARFQSTEGIPPSMAMDPPK
jgi:peptidoglycan/LPS O-acetylase OafA/YrhL